MPEAANLPPERPRRIACARCGTAFACLADGTGRCWCGTEAFRLPVPLPEGFGPYADCLCPPACAPSLPNWSRPATAPRRPC